MDPDHGSSPAFDWLAHDEVLFIRSRATTPEAFDACIELSARLHAEVRERIARAIASGKPAAPTLPMAAGHGRAHSLASR